MEGQRVFDWEGYKERIWHWYIREDRSVSDVEQLLPRHPGVSDSKLERKLKQWGFRKNLKKNDINLILQGRNVFGNSVVVILSGRRLPAAQVNNTLYRNSERPTLAAKYKYPVEEITSYFPGIDSTIAISKPRDDCDMRRWEPWPSSLPWISFEDSTADLFTANRLGHSVDSTSMCAFPNFLRMATHENISRQNVDRIAVNLDLYIPEAYEGRNIRMAFELTGSSPESHLETLKLMMFQISNNFLGNMYMGSIEYWPIERLQQLLKSFQVLGLERRSTITALFDLAPAEATISVLLDTLLSIAKRTEAVELFSALLAETKERSGQGFAFSQSQIESAWSSAIFSRNRNFAEVVLGQPGECSNVALNNEFGTQCLCSCAKNADFEFATNLASILLIKGAKIRSIHAGYLTPLLIAILNSNCSLVSLLEGYGADISEIAVPSSGFWLSSYVKVPSFWETADAFVCAVTLSNCHFPDYHERHSTKDLKQEEERAMSMYSFLLQKVPSLLAIESTQDLVEGMVPLNVLISAAVQGADGLIRMLRPTPKDLNRVNNKGVWPLCAAILGDNVSTCRLLLELGADPDFDPTPISLRPWPPALHLAAIWDSSKVAELLIKRSADVNRESVYRLEFSGDDSETVETVVTWEHSNPGEPIGPLTFALRHGSLSVAVSLVDSGAIFTLEDLQQAVDCGHNSLVERMINSSSYRRLRNHFTLSNKSMLQLLQTAMKSYSCSLFSALIQDNSSIIDDLELATEITSVAVLTRNINMCQLLRSRYPDICNRRIRKRTFLANEELKVTGRTILSVALEYSDATTCEALAESCDKLLQTPGDLTQAARIGSLPIVRSLWKEPQSVEELSTALTTALRYGHSKIAWYLIEARTPFSSGWLAYLFWAHPPDFVSQLLLLAVGTGNVMEASKQRTPCGRSSLETAILNDQFDVVDLALKHLRMYDSGALCASVRLAGTQSKFGPMRELLARRDTAKPDEIDPVLENTAIVLAARYKMLDAFEQLLQHPQPREDCATSDCSDWDFTDPFRYYYELGLGPVDFFHNPNSKSQCDDPSPSDWAGWHHPGRRIYPPLFVIVSFRDEQLFQAMLNRGYQPDGKTLLAAAALGYSHSMLKAIIGTAIDLGYRQTDLSPTVLQWAVYYRKSSLCQLLLDHGANINAPHFYDIRCSGEDRARTALQAAIEESETANTSTLVALALRAGAFVDAPAHYQRGATALQIAAIQGKIALARDLIRLKADVNAARGLVGGRTCLEGAAEHGRLDMVKFLLESGVQTTQEHRVQYIRAIRFAIEREHQRVADFLRSHREWDSTDDTVFKESHLTTDRVFRRIGRYRRRSREAEWCAFIHPLEHPLPERLKLRCWCRKTHIALPLDPEAEEYETNQNTDMVSVNHRYTAKIFQDQPDLQHGALPAGTLASILQVNEEQDWMEADSVNEEADLQSLFYNRQDCQDYSNLQLDTEMQGCEKWWGNRMLLDSRINQSVDFREIIEIDE